ncbi:synphilin-1 isoform X1 [Pleurodeles waltl]|uniref:synphilin-1 isoform X1 n=1 Tax=Pleurodeles waltl TaxID=8319 RepID=UPI00370990B2
MEAPEYLDLDEIDFTDDISYSVTSLKTIPELCRRCDSQNEDRSVSSTNWSSGVPTLIGNTQKPTGIADVYSKFRPVKRVSPLKHQPENPESNESDDQKEEKEGYSKSSEPEEHLQPGRLCPEDDPGLRNKGVESAIVLGELEHYDLDMDEILDVPYLKSSQQMATLPRAAPEKRTLGLRSSFKGLPCPAGTSDSLPASSAQFCVLSPVKSCETRKAQPIVLDQHKHSAEGLELSQTVGKSGGAAHEPETPGKGFLGCSSPKAEATMPHCHLRAFHLQTAAADSKLDQPSGNTSWSEERGDDAKKIKSLLNIVREGQMSLLPHMAVENLDKIHDETGSNLLHIAASQGHAECLQHLTSLMGEDCLNERNVDTLTPAGLAIKNGHLECVRWMVSETEAIAELSCSKDHPSLIHYAASYGQEKILLWLLQFMQEQGISLDEVDHCGNSAVHVAAQHGHLGCIQTLVEYGANVTMQNQSGEKPSQAAERQGHTMCSRYLVVVETCMSLASQVVKLTKQLKEQTTERVTLQNQLQHLLEAQKSECRSLPTSPSSSLPSSGKHQWKASDSDDSLTQTNKASTTPDGLHSLGSPGAPNHLRSKTKDEDSDKVLRQLLGKEISENVCTQEKLTLEFQDGQGPRHVKKTLPEKRELKLARLKQIMQRTLSESDTDSNHSEDPKNTPVRIADKPRPQPIVENVENTESLQLMIKKHTSSSSGRRFTFGIRASKSVDGHSPSPTSESSDPDNESQYQLGSAPRGPCSADACDAACDSATAQKIATSPKSALKSPSSKRRTAQNAKLRVTFEEPVGQTEVDVSGEKDKDCKSPQAVSPNGETGDQQKRPFGAIRSIMETLSGNQNSNNNNYQAVSLQKASTTLPFSSIGRKGADVRANPLSLAKGKKNSGPYIRCASLSSRMLREDHLHNYVCHNATNGNRRMHKYLNRISTEELEQQEFFL